MELHCELLLYLDKRRYLGKMKDDCENFLESLTEKTVSKFPSLRCFLEIDVMDVIDVLPSLGELIIKEPLKLQKMCNDVLFACLRSIDVDNYKLVEYSQVVVVLRLKCVPRILCLPNPKRYKGLTYFEGTLLAKSESVSYVYHTVWSCPEDCEDSVNIIHYIPKTPPKCCICRSTMYENSGLRRCGDQVTATFKLKGDYLLRKFYIVDDLIPKLKVGLYYALHAIVGKSIIIWSLEKIKQCKAPMTHPVPRDLDVLYNACNRSPWKFIYCLASSLAVNVCPLNCFIQLKINLLLSLASIKANVLTNSNIIHVLATGFDTRFVGEIMNEAAKLTDKNILIGTSNTDVATALIAGTGGIAAFPLPLHAYNQKQIFSVLSAIESGEIMNETSKTKLKCAVWAHGMDFKKIVMFNVASVFGNVCRGDHGEFSDNIVEYLLQGSIEPSGITEDELRALKDISTYLSIVAGIEVELDKLPETLLRSYFLAARKERPRAVAISSMNSLITVSLTSARLCRRSVVTIEDAIFAIWLHVCGFPEPRFAPEEYLETPMNIRKLNKIMDGFKHWLEQFTGMSNL
ncbi:uncharacterized protein LOC114244451 [Bombyx mandarina]|uniref:Uncharacterized protein LOC114244451 n=1 Tax=Bombyx mandarina TaxID=7092 RepID=A0A6J2JQR9_BOMMA|nr:uncharacterized protein LOC114244451 [Bombyx mandarina]